MTHMMRARQRAEVNGQSNLKYAWTQREGGRGTSARQRTWMPIPCALPKTRRSPCANRLQPFFRLQQLQQLQLQLQPTLLLDILRLEMEPSVAAQVGILEVSMEYLEGGLDISRVWAQSTIARQHVLLHMIAQPLKWCDSVLLGQRVHATSLATVLCRVTQLGSTC